MMKLRIDYNLVILLRHGDDILRLRIRSHGVAVSVATIELPHFFYLKIIMTLHKE